MFDPETERFLREALPLGEETIGVDELPNLLSRAYTEIVAARIKSPNSGSDSTEWAQTRDTLRRLAETYEYVTLALPPDSPHRAASAFVAASAHHALARGPAAGPIGQLDELLTRRSVAGPLSASLLFLIGEHYADAHESARLFEELPGTHPSIWIVRGVAALAAGSGRRLAEFRTAVPAVDRVGGSADMTDAAEAALWWRVADGLVALANSLLGDDQSGDPATIFREVAASASRRLAAGQLPGLVVSLPFEGIAHVARLLECAAGSLQAGSTAAIPPPLGVDADAWRNFLRRLASRRPFMWRNHRQALSSGLLTEGSSSVLTFPTGAGKTALTEIRIAADLLRGRDVVYIAPTRSLVDQVTRDTRPLQADVSALGSFASIVVHTPEQLLARFADDDALSGNIGLIVVDECHQLSGAAGTEGVTVRPPRRSVDAMWALLSLLERAPGADCVLLSAMVANADDLAQWLREVTSRPCQALTLQWRPTRQVRGVVAYDAAEIAALRKLVDDERATGRRKGPPKALVEQAHATPFGIFCLTQVWRNDSGYSILQLLAEKVPLAVGGDESAWWLSANRNVVAARLASAFALGRMRCLVFSQVVGYTEKIATDVAALLGSHLAEVPCSGEEDRLFAAAAIELGGEEHVIRPVGGLVGVHHGRLLASERRAMESAFGRPGGLPVLVATPTVAQGLNLPAEVVILAGDDRRVETAAGGSSEVLPVHEVLNAAGRAGRAGHFAHGVVLDVPGTVIDFSTDETSFHIKQPKKMEQLKSLFGQMDQCLKVVDPIAQAIDVVSFGEDDVVAHYLLRRCQGRSREQLKAIFARAMWMNMVPASERPARLEEVASVVEARLQTLEQEEGLDEECELAAKFGVSVGAIRGIVAELEWMANESDETPTFASLLDAVVGAITKDEQRLFALVDPDSSDIAQIVGGAPSNAGWAPACLKVARDGLGAWMDGRPIHELDAQLMTMSLRKKRVPGLDLGRRFALQSASALGGAASVVVQAVRALVLDGEASTLASWLALVPGCLREGFRDPDMLLASREFTSLADYYPRVRIHEQHGLLDAHLEPLDPELGPQERRAQVRAALDAAGLRPT